MIVKFARRFASTSKFRDPTIAIFSGSAREDSVNTKLAKAAEKVAKNLGANTKFIDLATYDLPLYNQDLEGSTGEMPNNSIHVLKSSLADSDGWIVASPEYNGFVTPLLLNSFTWCSRGDLPGEMYATFKGKSAIILSASPGAMGGMRAHNPCRLLLNNLGVNVLPLSVAIGGAFQAFDENGDLKDEKLNGMLQNAVESLFLLSRDTANREAVCEVVQSHIVGEYGAVHVAK